VAWADAYLCSAWLVRDDFLLTRIEGRFDFVVGNPPYVRQERIPAALLAEYRRRFHTLYDRADIYVPFFERALDLLDADGVLGFICANRWLKNRYGGPLRDKISKGYWLKNFINMEGVDAFHAEVIAYPAPVPMWPETATPPQLLKVASAHEYPSPSVFPLETTRAQCVGGNAHSIQRSQREGVPAAVFVELQAPDCRSCAEPPGR